MISRYASATSIGLVVTFALLFVMQLLITIQPSVAVEVGENRPVTWHSPVKSPPPPAPAPKPFKREHLTNTLTAPRPTLTDTNEWSTHIPRTAPHIPNGEYTLTPHQYIDGPLASTLRVSPVYPAAMAARGIEGHVLLQFDVMANGRVANIAVLDASHNGFARAAINAAKRLRFKPRVVDGVPTGSTGIQNLFRFRLDDT